MIKMITVYTISMITILIGTMYSIGIDKLVELAAR